MYVLGEKTGFGYLLTEFYKGKTYQFQFQYYPSVTNKKEEAKKYSTEAKAINACKKLNNKVGRRFEVIKID
jgi:hypothetical protein